MPTANILFLAANPGDTTPLSLDEEVRAIETMLRTAEHRDAFAFVSRWAARADDLQQQLLEQRPVIVHFSGHGELGSGLILAGDRDSQHSVSPAALAGLLRVLRDRIRVVSFNACHSLELAEAVAQEIECVIGMGDAISDEAARVFAASFYRGLGFGRSVGEAFELGRAALLLEGISEDRTPQLLTRPGVDPRTVHVLEPAVAAKPRVALIAAEDDAAWLKKLQMHLRPLARTAGFEVWDPSKVAAGTRWREAVAEGFAGAQAVVVIVSPSLLADEEFESRLPELLARARANSVSLLPLIVSAHAVGSTGLDSYQALNNPAAPLDAMNAAEQGKVLVAAAEQIAASVRAR
jgi:hypothetical protein